MFFTNDPKEFEPLEKEQLDAMLEVWEKELIEARNRKLHTDRERNYRATIDRMLAAHNLILVNPKAANIQAA